MTGKAFLTRGPKTEEEAFELIGCMKGPLVPHFLRHLANGRSVSAYGFDRAQQLTGIAAQCKPTLQCKRLGQGKHVAL